MKVLVIGGTHFIGPHVVRRLAEHGHEVTVFNRDRTKADFPDGVGRIMGDRHNLASFTENFKRYVPDVVLDMIPMNGRDAKTLVKVFREITQRVVAISSEDVYRAYDIVRRRHPGPPDPTPLTEDSPLRERLYPYDREGVEEYEKILVEKIVMDESKLPGTILRLPAVYGPGDYQHRLFPYLKRMDDGRPAILLEEGVASWRWTHGYVEDVAEAIALAATDERAAGGIYNIGELAPLPCAEWVRKIGYAAGWDGEILDVPKGSLPNNPMAGLNTGQDWIVDTSRIRQELGYGESVSREEALQRTVAWERQNPPAYIEASHFDYAAEDALLTNI